MSTNAKARVVTRASVNKNRSAYSLSKTHNADSSQTLSRCYHVWLSRTEALAPKRRTKTLGVFGATNACHNRMMNSRKQMIKTRKTWWRNAMILILRAPVTQKSIKTWDAFGIANLQLLLAEVSTLLIPSNVDASTQGVVIERQKVAKHLIWDNAFNLNGQLSKKKEKWLIVVHASYSQRITRT